MKGTGRGRGYSHDPDPGLLSGLTVKTPRVPWHQRGLPTGITDEAESLWDPCVLRGTGGTPSPISWFGGADGIGDVVPARLTIRGVNL